MTVYLCLAHNNRSADPAIKRDAQAAWEPAAGTTLWLAKAGFGRTDMGKSSQKKGRGGESELARLLKALGYPVEAGSPCNHGTTPDVTGLPDIHIEVKRVEKLNVPEALRQAARDSEKFHDGFPALFHRRNREPWMVTMRMGDWLALYEAYERDKGT